MGVVIRKSRCRYSNGIFVLNQVQRDLFSNARSATSNNNIFHNNALTFKHCFLKNIINMKISDVDIKNGNIVFRVSSLFGMRSIFHNLCSPYFQPIDLIKKDIMLFSNDEKDLIYACNTYNNALNKLEEGVDFYSSIVFDEKITLEIHMNDNKIIYQFDESKFTELMKKYTSKKEIRKLLKNLFTFKPRGIYV
jgi:hypothetical protein